MSHKRGSAIATWLGLTVVSTLSYQPPTIAQIIPDETLSTTVSTSDNFHFVIEGGTQSGPHLFHSFDTFSIPTNGSGAFNNAPDIATIFSRVTGGSVSDIQGNIRTNGTADLFLMNPSGIVFGENASLNISGSFFATTAEGLIFEGAQPFSAVHPKATVPLLSISISPGLQMGQGSGPIVINGPGHATIGGGFFPFFNTDTTPGLHVNTGQTLGIVAPDIHLIGGIIKTTGANIQLSSASAGVLTFNNNQETWVADSTTVEYFGDLQLSQQSFLQSSGILSGDISLQGQNIRILDGSLVMAQHLGSEPGGDIHLDATDVLKISGDARVAPDQDTLLGPIPGVAASIVSSETLGTGSAGNIVVTSSHLQITRGGQLMTRSYGSGNTGNLNIDIAETIELRGTSTLAPNLLGGVASATFRTGNAGNIQVKTQNLSITDGSGLFASTVGKGRGGNINVQVTDDLTIEGIEPTVGSFSSLITGTGGSGDSGDIVIDTARLTILNGANLSTGTVSDGNAGSLTVNASEWIRVDGTVPSAGLVSLIDSDARPAEASLSELIGPLGEPNGNSGNVELNTPLLEVVNGGMVSVSNEGTGNSGQLQINADKITLDHQGRITALSTSGQGGDIELNLDTFLLLNRGSTITTEAIGRLSEVSTQVESDAQRSPPEQTNVDGGNMVINASFILGFNNSDITANAFEGNGGNISIATQGLFGLEFRNERTNQSDITASSEFGLSGTVEIVALDVDPASNSTLLPTTIANSPQIATACNTTADSRFILAGRGGLPLGPEGKRGGDRPWPQILPDFGPIPTQISDLPLQPPSQLPNNSLIDGNTGVNNVVNQPMILTEATGMAIAPNGTLHLIASTAQRPIVPPPTCTPEPTFS